MNRRTVILSISLAAALFSLSACSPAVRPDPVFERRKAELLSRVENRIRHLQDDKACIEAAQNHYELQRCRPARPDGPPEPPPRY
ncbi:MAG: hypothetical protein K8I29_08670 [Alphaproteobacteria bacterium]|uniref:Lipoprotein n=1 Tax=Candidatus Nitrobium versatile TaxID=2884831 RepID=A0A953JCV1_9BACT|nr:hypothetical protein [Candidatus Nitrobium versatile]